MITILIQVRTDQTSSSSLLPSFPLSPPSLILPYPLLPLFSSFPSLLYLPSILLPSPISYLPYLFPSPSHPLRSSLLLPSSPPGTHVTSPERFRHCHTRPLQLTCKERKEKLHEKLYLERQHRGEKRGCDAIIASFRSCNISIKVDISEVLHNYVCTNKFLY